MQGADEQIARTKRIMQDMDKLDAKLEEVDHVCDVVRKLKKRCDAAGGRLDNIAVARASQQPRPR